jgi:hypothetical protein
MPESIEHFGHIIVIDISELRVGKIKLQAFPVLLSNSWDMS